jgi:hypothetical protein
VSVCLTPMTVAGAETAASNSTDCGSAREGNVLSTPQVVDLQYPLTHVRSASGHIAVRSAVVTVADPLEKHLGRAFDIQLSSLIRAFQTKDYRGCCNR